MQKQKTRLHILNTAKELFIKKGFLNITTAQIAELADVAHGTLFLHFKSKNSLILEILDEQLYFINDQIGDIIRRAGDLPQMLSLYLNLLQADEDFFSVIARELPFYPAELRRLILFRDSIIRSYFHKMIEAGIAAGSYRQVDITVTVTFLFGTINYYLSLKSIFVQEESVIGKFKQAIQQNFMLLLTSDKGAEHE